jgi:hypothetical protein
MPNWVQTNLNVTGPQDDISRLMAGATTKNEDGVDVIAFIPNLIPVPEELNILSGSMSSDSPEYENWAKQQASNVLKYGHRDWYSWTYDNWGTKWGDCDTYVDSALAGSLAVTFQTAWGPADKAWLAISEMFPTLSFEFYYDEEAGFFEGYHVMRNGEIVLDAMYAPCDFPMEVDWDNEDSIAGYEHWKDVEREKIEAELFAFYVKESVS